MPVSFMVMPVPCMVCQYHVGYASIMYGDASIMYGDASIMYGGGVLTKSSYLQTGGPRFVENAVFKPPESNIEEYLKCLQEYRVWMLTA